MKLWIQLNDLHVLIALT